MKRPVIALAAAAVMMLGACAPQPTTGGATTGSVGGIPLGPYFLVGIGADAVPERNATLVLSDKTLSGRGPCNSFTASSGAALPAMAITAMNWTDMACKEQRFEQRYFTALQQVTSAEFDGGLLILKGPTWLQFEAGYPKE